MPDRNHKLHKAKYESRDMLNEELTTRELQVIQLLIEGASNRVLAEKLGISEHTAKFHMNNLMKKLGTNTRTEAAIEAVRRGLVKLDNTPQV